MVRNSKIKDAYERGLINIPLYLDILRKIGGINLDDSYEKKENFNKIFSRQDIKRVRNASATSHIDRITLEIFLPDTGEPKTVKALVKYFQEKLPDGYVTPTPKRWERAHAMYEFLRGIACVPRRFESRIGKTYFFDYPSEKTLEEQLEECEIKKERKDLMNSITDTIIKFQADTTEKFADLKLEGDRITRLLIEKLFGERTMEEKILGYVGDIRGVEKIPKEVESELVEVAKIFEKFYEIKSRVCHGDLCLTNILVGNEEIPFYLIDPDLKLREGITDLAYLLSCPGISIYSEDNGARFNLEDIEEAANYFWESEEKQREVRPALQRWENTVKERKLATVHVSRARDSLKFLSKMAKTKRLFPGVYEHWVEKRRFLGHAIEEMQYNINSSLLLLINRPENLGITQEDAEGFLHIKDIFTNLEIIPEKNKINNSRDSYIEKQAINHKI